jgi:hypothetical protein
MEEPHEVDWEPSHTTTLLYKLNLARIVAFNPESMASGVMAVDSFTDSDWAGRLDTRRSSDASVVATDASVVIAHPQTQPGLSATSSGEPKRAASKGGRDIIFIKQLGEGDLGLVLATPRAWTDANTAFANIKTVGHRCPHATHERGSPLCPRLVSQKGKVPGTSNPSNCLTKHLDAELKGQRCQDLAAVGFSRSNLQPLLEAAEQIELVGCPVVPASEAKIRNAMETKFCNRRWCARSVCPTILVRNHSSNPYNAFHKHWFGVSQFGHSMNT